MMLTAGFCLSCFCLSLHLYMAWESHLQRVKKRTLSYNKNKSLKMSIKGHYFVMTCWAFCCHTVGTGLEPGTCSDKLGSFWKDLKPPCYSNIGQHSHSPKGPNWSDVRPQRVGSFQGSKTVESGSKSQIWHKKLWINMKMTV